MTCFTTDRIAGRCCACAQQIVSKAHWVDDKLYCSTCCPVHRDVHHFVGALKTVAGEQVGLFETEEEKEYPD